MIFFPRTPVDNAVLCAWLEERLTSAKFTHYQCVGVMRGEKLVGVVCFHNHVGPNVEVSVASDDPRWLSAGVLRALAHYPFEILKVARVSAVTHKRNKRARKGVERLGFKLEGVLRKMYENDDACVYGLLREDFRYA